MQICHNNSKSNLNTRQNINFDGKFYAVTDVHSRASKIAGVLTEIEQRCSDKAPATFLDGGDFTAGSYRNEATIGLYTKFAQRNPHIKAICTLGNCELFDFTNPNQIDKFKNYTKTLLDGGVQVVSATVGFLSQKLNIKAEGIKPYTIIEDIVDGQKKKVLLTSLSITTDNLIELENQKNILKNILPQAIADHKPDRIILMSHNFLPDTKELTKYIKEDLKIDNLDLVIGGHPHSLEDETQNATRILYPPVQGKGALEIELTSKGFEIPEISRFELDAYNYDSLDSNGNEVVKNHKTGVLAPIHPEYQAVIDTKEPRNMTQKIVTGFHTFQYRTRGKFATESCELGTFISNALRDQTRADFGMLLTMDLREKLPGKGQEISLYNIKDSLNVDKPVYILQVKPDQLLEIFKLSLKDQSKKDRNNQFIEFSDNIKIERFVGLGENEQKIKQIFIKRKNKWVPLLDSKGQVRKKIADKTFTIATCDYVAKAKRDTLNLFKSIPSEPYQNESLTTEGAFIKALKDNEHNPNFTIKRSEIVDILPQT